MGVDSESEVPLHLALLHFRGVVWRGSREEAISKEATYVDIVVVFRVSFLIWLVVVDGEISTLQQGRKR